MSAIEKFVSGQDVFVSLPTRFGKSVIYGLPYTDNNRSSEGTHSTHIDCTDCESFGVSHGRPKGKVLLDLQARCVCHRRRVTILIAHTSLSKLLGVKLLH